MITKIEQEFALIKEKQIIKLMEEAVSKTLREDLQKMYFENSLKLTITQN